MRNRFYLNKFWVCTSQLYVKKPWKRFQSGSEENISWCSFGSRAAGWHVNAGVARFSVWVSGGSSRECWAVFMPTSAFARSRSGCIWRPVFSYYCNGDNGILPLSHTHTHWWGKCLQDDISPFQTHYTRQSPSQFIHLRLHRANKSNGASVWPPAASASAPPARIQSVRPLMIFSSCDVCFYRTRRSPSRRWVSAPPTSFMQLSLLFNFPYAVAGLVWMGGDEWGGAFSQLYLVTCVTVLWRTL